jgi:acyl-CoA thioester hydrolase
MLQLGDDILTGFVLVKFSVNYLAPLFFPGSVDIGTVVTRVGRSSYNLGQGIFDGEKCVATAEVVTVFIDANTKKSQELTHDLRTILERAMKV